MGKESIKATVLTDFLDRENRGLMLKKGQEIEREESRIKELADRGFVERVEDKGLNKEPEAPKKSTKNNKQGE